MKWSLALAIAFTLPTSVAFADEPRRVAYVDPTTGSIDVARPFVADAPKPAEPAADRFGYQVEVGLANTYVFRGRPQYRNRTDPSSQNTAALTVKSVGPGDLSVTVWNQIAVDGYRAQPGTALEFDTTAAYAVRLFDRVDASIGYLGYFYPKAADGQHVDGSHELFVTAALAQWVAIPSLGVYADAVRLKGVYVNPAIAKRFESGPVAFTPQLGVGFAAYQAVPAQVNDVTASAALQWTFEGPLYLALRGWVSYLGAPASARPDGDGSIAKRVVPSAMLAIGASR